MTDSSIPSMIIFVVFGVVVLAVFVAAVTTIWEHILPPLERWLGGETFSRALSGRVGALRNRLRRHDEERDDDDLNDATAALLSMIPSASLVVDEHDEVVRANPEAYRLGVVSDDALTEPTVLEAVRQVRASGGRKTFDIETSTPVRYIPASEGMDGWPGTDGGSAAGGYAGMNGGNTDFRDRTIRETSNIEGVSRPNWMKVTVGRIDERFVVVLLDDVSDAIRFSQMRDSFIVNVSEQLLKPTEALERLSAALEGDELDSVSLKRDAHEVRVASGHLNHLVSDLLLLIKAQEPVTPSTANRLNVMEQLEAVERDMADDIAASGVHVSVAGDAGLIVNGEADQIRSAIRKLVENAIAYSPAGSAVSVSAKPSADGSQAVIRVIDQGSGIAKADQARIFERFYRGGNQNERSAGGVGLGLAIVKHVALTHHGTAGVWSAPGKGSTFSLTLPVAAQL